MLTARSRRLRSLRLEEGDQAAHLADIEAIDRVLINVLGFTGDIAAETKDFRREALFGRSELRGAVIAVLREANEPLTTRQITERVMATKGKALKPGRQSKDWITRARRVPALAAGAAVGRGGAGVAASKTSLTCVPHLTLTKLTHPIST